MHSYENTENYAKKRDNWQQLQLFFYKRKIPIVLSSIDALILNEQDTTLEFVKQVYSLLTEKRLLPPAKLYENAQTEGLISNPMKGPKDSIGLGIDDTRSMDRDKIAEKSVLQGKGITSNRSP
jgi:hypothetical protein